jgi:pimeloyl-ACP methyl ester carboxylesterase
MSMTPSPNARLNIVDRPGAEPAFVLMHGFPDDHHIYDRLAPLLAPRRVVSFDFFGYGRSGRAEGDGAAVTPARDLIEVIDSRDLGHVVLVAHDASGPVAVDHALDHPDGVDHVVLLDTYYGHAPAQRLPEMIRLFAEPTLKPLADAMAADPGQLLWLLQHTARQFFGSDDLPSDGIAVTSILPQFFADADGPDALVAIRAWTGRLFADLNAQDSRITDGELAALQAPVTLLAGEYDNYLGPRLAHELAGYFPQAEVVVVPKASHWPQWDQPEFVARALTKATN